MTTPVNCKRRRQFHFTCPVCGVEQSFATEIVAGPNKGSYFNRAYLCEHCGVRCKMVNGQLLGAILGAALGVFGGIIVSLLAHFGWPAQRYVVLPTVGILSLIYGWFVVRFLSKILLRWEKIGPSL